ncbi:hypothetical protein CASFOL_005041 [Castilleja foliolosa]|uniref:Uncharacterized protein n=1 Tax=Castilleja foliolosa TaxID=1961234 RepID=A0ABD3E2A9_9LAMI
MDGEVVPELESVRSGPYSGRATVNSLDLRWKHGLRRCLTALEGSLGLSEHLTVRLGGRFRFGWKLSKLGRLAEARSSGVDGDEKLDRDLDWVRGWIWTAAQCLSPTQGV